MSKDHNDRVDIKVQEQRTVGAVQIANDVVANMAGIAAMEVEGVASILGNITKELAARMGRKSLSKGIKVDVESGKVSVQLSLVLKYGYNIPEVSKRVQEKVKNTIETMTGLSVFEVNVRIVDVNLDNDK